MPKAKNTTEVQKESQSSNEVEGKDAKRSEFVIKEIMVQRNVSRDEAIEILNSPAK